jgi:hypothetical protein
MLTCRSIVTARLTTIASHLLLTLATLRLHSLRRSRWEPRLPNPLLIVQGATALFILSLELGHEVADVAVGIQRLVAADKGQLLRREPQAVFQRREEVRHTLPDATMTGCFKGRFKLLPEPAVLKLAEDLRRGQVGDHSKSGADQPVVFCLAVGSLSNKLGCYRT